MPPRKNKGGDEQPTDRVLLVEGPDDQHLVWNLLECHHLSYGVTVEDGKGYPNIHKGLATRIKAANQRVLGVLVDADADFGGRWQSLSDILVKAGYENVPEALTITGTTITQADMPTIGVWIMPDNQSQGMLEDFARSLIPTHDRLWKRAITVVNDIPEEDRLFNPPGIAKARIHTWLAWQEDPGKAIGQALKSGALDASAQPGKALVNWLRELFELT